MTSGKPEAIEIKALVPAEDFALSLRFYEALGFTVDWSTGDLACLRYGSTSFLLQNFFVKAHAHNMQMHLWVEDADAWHSRLQSLRIADNFAVTIGAIEDRPWGMRDFTLSDPSGVLWRIGHPIGMQ